MYLKPVLLAYSNFHPGIHRMGKTALIVCSSVFTVNHIAKGCFKVTLLDTHSPERLFR